jgi:hypothetical protein
MCQPITLSNGRHPLHGESPTHQQWQSQLNPRFLPYSVPVGFPYIADIVSTNHRVTLTIEHCQRQLHCESRVQCINHAASASTTAIIANAGSLGIDAENWGPLGDVIWGTAGSVVTKFVSGESQDIVDDKFV